MLKGPKEGRISDATPFHLQLLDGQRNCQSHQRCKSITQRLKDTVNKERVLERKQEIRKKENMASAVTFAPSVPVKFSDGIIGRESQEDLYAKFKALQRQEEFLDLQVCVCVCVGVFDGNSYGNIWLMLMFICVVLNYFNNCRHHIDFLGGVRER